MASGVLLIACALVTMIIGRAIFSFHENDAAGRGMTRGFAILGSSLLWILLGAVCALGASPLSWIYWAVAMAGQFAALSILQGLEAGDRFESILRATAIACPSLVALDALWNNFPGPRGAIPAGAAHLAAGIPIIATAAIPWLVLRPSRSLARARNEARRQAYEEARQREQALIDKVMSLPPTTPLRVFLEYAGGPLGSTSELREVALNRMRILPHRQADAEELLDRPEPGLLRVIADLDLEMTSALCEAARKSVRQLIRQFRPPHPVPSFESIEVELNTYMGGLTWLVQKSCPCLEEIAALEQTVRLYPFSYPRKWVTDQLLELQGKPREP